MNKDLTVSDENEWKYSPKTKKNLYKEKYKWDRFLIFIICKFEKSIITVFILLICKCIFLNKKAYYLLLYQYTV